MLDPLGMLVITFVVMSVISVIGVVMMYLTKSEKVKKGFLYFLSVWGMIIAWCSVQSTPEYMTMSILLAWGWGALSVIALLMQLCMKNEKTFNIARILVTVSVVVGMLDCFII